MEAPFPKKGSGPRESGRIDQIARGLVGCHYINGAYGASCRRDIVEPVADPRRLDPAKQADKRRDLAAHKHIVDPKQHVDRYRVCGGNYQHVPWPLWELPATNSPRVDSTHERDS